MDFIQGEARKQYIMFPDLLDDYITEDNPTRVIDAYVEHLDLDDLAFTKAVPNDTGRPMYCAKDMLKLYIYGYMNRTRSSRRLEAESKKNVELMWLLCKLSPDHKTISRFRKDNKKALKNVFRDFSKLCLELGLYGRELIAVDGSRFQAVNSKENNFNFDKIKDRLKRINNKINTYLEELDTYDAEENNAESEESKAKINKIIEDLEARKEKYEELRTEMREAGVKQKSLTDPDSRRMTTAHGGSMMAYNIQSAVDNKHNLIAEFEVTNAGNDKGQLSDMTKMAMEVLEVDHITSIADTGYNVGTDIGECIMNNIEPHISMKEDFVTICVEVDKEEANEPKAYENGRLVYLKDRNIVVCPMGQVLTPTTYRKARGVAIYARAKACNHCAHKCINRDAAKSFERTMKPEEFSREYKAEDLYIKQIQVKRDVKLLKRRKAIVEHPFGTIKRTMDSGYCLMKGIENVRGEFSLTFLAYNLKRVINILGTKELIEAIEAR